MIKELSVIMILLKFFPLNEKWTLKNQTPFNELFIICHPPRLDTFGNNSFICIFFCHFMHFIEENHVIRVRMIRTISFINSIWRSSVVKTTGKLPWNLIQKTCFVIPVACRKCTLSTIQCSDLFFFFFYLLLFYLNERTESVFIRFPLTFLFDSRRNRKIELHSLCYLERITIIGHL